MKMNELQPQPGAVTKRTIVGRGIGSGKGKTCGSGHKGQKSRSGVAINGFEGGQMPLYMRLPKFGFSNVAFSKKMSVLTLTRLQDALDRKKLDPKKPIDESLLVESGVVRRRRDGIKLLATGALKTKVDITVTKASGAARAAVEKAGGKITILAEQQDSAASAKKAAKKS